MPDAARPYNSFSVMFAIAKNGQNFKILFCNVQVIMHFIYSRARIHQVKKFAAKKRRIAAWVEGLDFGRMS